MVCILARLSEALQAASQSFCFLVAPLLDAGGRRPPTTVGIVNMVVVQDIRIPFTGYAKSDFDNTITMESDGPFTSYPIPTLYCIQKFSMSCPCTLVLLLYHGFLGIKSIFQ